MSGAVILGIIIAVMFLTAFTEWFYHVAAGVNESIIKDIYFYYRLGVWIVGGLVFMAGVFWVLALAQECPDPTPKTGIFQYMECDVYWESRSFVERRPVSVLMKEAAEKFTRLEYEQ